MRRLIFDIGGFGFGDKIRHVTSFRARGVNMRVIGVEEGKCMATGLGGESNAQTCTYGLERWGAFSFLPDVMSFILFAFLTILPMLACADFTPTAQTYTLSPSMSSHSDYVSFSNSGLRSNGYYVEVPNNGTVTVLIEQTRYQQEGTLSRKFEVYLNGNLYNRETPLSLLPSGSGPLPIVLSSSAMIGLGATASPQYTQHAIYNDKGVILGYQKVYNKNYWVQFNYTIRVIYGDATGVQIPVVFNSNGGSACSTRLYTVGNTYGSLPEPTKSDHSVFDGWYSDSALTRRVYTSTKVSTSVTTLYAKWISAGKVKSISIEGSSILYPGGETNYVCVAKLDTGETKEVKATWSIDSAPSGRVSINATTGKLVSERYSDITSPITIRIKASFTTAITATKTITIPVAPKSISIYGDDDIAKGGQKQYTCKATMRDGSTKWVTPNWSVEAGWSSSSITADGVLKVNQSISYNSVTIKAVYREGQYSCEAKKTITINNSVAVQKVTVSFESNGGSACSSRQYTVGNTYESLPTPTRSDGYAFLGWYSNASLTTRVYTYTTVSASVTKLYAKWTAVTTPTYTVAYNPGSYGSGSQRTDTKKKDVALTLKGAIFTRTGYTQTGWSKNSNGSTKDYNLSVSYTANAAITLYPYWTANTYTVSYTMNGGTKGASSPSSATYGTAFKVSAPTKWGGAFAGWTVSSGLNTGTAKYGTSSSGQMSSIASTSQKCLNGVAGDVWFKNLTPNASGSVMLTANWSPVSRTPENDGFSSPVTISGSSGSISGSNVGATMQTSEQKPSVRSSATGSVWYKWTAPSSGTVTFDTIGSSFDTILGVYVGTSVSALAESESNDDIEIGNFMSRVTFPVIAGTIYRIAIYGYNGATGSLTLNWSMASANSVAVSFNTYGGSSCSSRRYAVGKTYGFLPNPIKWGYSFDGWYTTPSLASKVTVNSKVSSSVTTLYAKWTDVISLAPLYNLLVSIERSVPDGILSDDELNMAMTISNYSDIDGNSDVISSEEMSIFRQIQKLNADKALISDVTDGLFGCDEETLFDFKTLADAIRELLAGNAYEVILDRQGGSGGTSSGKADGGDGNAQPGGSRSVSVVIGNTETFVAVVDGDVWGTKLPKAEPVPGKRFVGWFTGKNGTGTRVTSSTVVSAATKKLYAYYVDEEDFYLYDPVAGAVSGAAASTYDGYLCDAQGNVKGTIQVKVGKPNAKTGLAALKATVVGLDGKKKNLKASGNGKTMIAANDPTTVSLVGGDACEVTLGAKGLSGTYGGYVIDGALNVFTSKDAADQAVASAALGKWQGAVNVAWQGAQGWNGLSVTIAAKGKAKVSGTLANGVKVAAMGQLAVGEEWCCVSVVVSKKAQLAFNMWLPKAATSAALPGVVGIADAVVGRPGSLKGGAKFHLGAVMGDAKYSAYLPEGLAVGGGTKWTLPNAGKVQLTKDGAVDASKLGENPSALKLTYKAKDGSFTGSFKAYSDVNGKPGATTVKVVGVLVNGVGYGTAAGQDTSAPITVE